MSLNKSTSDAEIPTGTVLFAAGQMKHDEFWDDTELIEHWDKTVELYKVEYIYLYVCVCIHYMY
ncbi:hypothetical protein BCV72DRAFT_200250 [Rhizopus microsporus var. microsporus]|uniref:Survival Motor Neuron Gemin2-binding domain-containing protein n=1 Tax=Rhizopus microsporus var. microsporus TaxID=86635 RepID=A0A1X0RDM2_RHIZD|nr:hypothetical protein BCV72DRAFT_200250 [Rhizopus microsporus var. microsporus]